MLAEEVVTSMKTPSKDKNLVIVGGQSGAGKSRLIKTAKREFNNNAVIVDFDEPRKIYSTAERQFPDAIAAIYAGREQGRCKAIEDFVEKYDMVENAFKRKQPELLEKLTDWKSLYINEKNAIGLNLMER